MYGSVEVYIDESGDLGFSSGSSKNFIIEAMIAPNKINFQRIVKKANEKLKIAGKCQAEVKFNNSNTNIRHFFIDRFCATECQVVWYAVQKTRVNADLRRKKDKLYNYMCGKVMGSVFSSVHTKNLNVIIDKRPGGRAERNDFDRYITGILDGQHLGMFPPELKLSHYDSCNNAGLRVNDFVAGSIFQHLERRDDQYYSKFENKVIIGRKLWG